MLRHSRRRVFGVTLLLILGLSLGSLFARQPFPAGIQQALITLGLWPYGVYGNNDIPVWNSATNTFEPGSGGGGLGSDVNIDEVGGVAIGSTVPISGSVTANAGTNLNTSALLTSTNYAAAFGTAGTADSQVMSIQGIAAMTPILATLSGTNNIATVTAVTSITNAVAVTGTFWQATQPISGTVTANIGTGLTVDPCTTAAKTPIVINIATGTTTELTPSLAGASNYYYVCSISIGPTAGAQNFALVDDDSDGCGSITSGMAGGTTAASGWNIAANGGLGMGNGLGTVFKTNGTNRVICAVTSASQQVSGTMMVVAAP